MEALDGLAVGEQDILARTTAPRRTRENRACSGDHGPAAREPSHGSCLPVRPVARGATHVSPFQSARESVCGVGYRTFHVETACETHFVPGGLKGRGPLAANA
jgi:hypothetical protein